MRQHRTPFVRFDHQRPVEIVDKHLERSKWAAQARTFGVSPADVHRSPQTGLFGMRLPDQRARACGSGAARARTIPHPMQLTRAASRSSLRERHPELCDGNLRIAGSRNCEDTCTDGRRPEIPVAKRLQARGVSLNEQGHRRIAEMLGDLYTSFSSGTLDAIFHTGEGRGTTSDWVLCSSHAFASDRGAQVARR
jgi:hypothetical protein